MVLAFIFIRKILKNIHIKSHLLIKISFIFINKCDYIKLIIIILIYIIIFINYFNY